MNTFNIGRNTIYGNPYKAKSHEKLQGKTLPDYERYIRLAISKKPLEFGTAYAIYKSATNIDLPVNFRDRVKDLKKILDKGEVFYCPGCKTSSCRDNICHGSILLKIVKELNE